jgi:bifunctional UDP-N-acetylglucosamine pyrophosphorylase/glucosamine-1-phosphate N-acetyltransferase
MTSKVNMVVLAAGLGTRMKSKRAKVLHRAGGMTLVEHVVETATSLTEPEWVTVVVGHQRHQVEAVLAHTGVKFVEQAEQKGTGHALKMCRTGLEERPGMVVVVYGDVPMLSSSTIRRLVEAQEDSGTAATLIATRMDDPTGYGRVLVDDAGYVRAIVEQKAATPEQLRINLANSGIYCFRGDLLWKHIDEIRPDNPAHEYYLTDMAEILTRAGHQVGVMEIQDNLELFGINTRVELAMVDRMFRERKANELMLSGVTIEKPETVSIDHQVRVGMDTVIEPYTRILGKTEIGEDCLIGASSVIQNSRLGHHVAIAPMTIIADSHIDGGAHIGPFARLRMHNHVESGAHIGNFVELKKTHFGAGAKANHLAYLGDSDIGEKVNVGAGTITCNFDGINKHKTRVGAGAFVGSNSTLVAPVEVGDQSYIAAGSVITKLVPNDALALARGRQETKEGWAARRRARKQD